MTRKVQFSNTLPPNNFVDCFGLLAESFVRISRETLAKVASAPSMMGSRAVWS
jgi:hypothetical protein